VLTVAAGFCQRLTAHAAKVQSKFFEYFSGAELFFDDLTQGEGC
jgi:hypothetical protein